MPNCGDPKPILGSQRFYVLVIRMYYTPHPSRSQCTPNWVLFWVIFLDPISGQFQGAKFQVGKPIGVRYSNPFINLSIFSIFRISSSSVQASTGSHAQAFKFSSVLQEFKAFNLSPLKIKDSCIQAIEGFYARSSILTFKISLHIFKILFCIFYIHPLKIYIHVHAFLWNISSTFIDEGFGVTLISFLGF